MKIKTKNIAIILILTIILALFPFKQAKAIEGKPELNVEVAKTNLELGEEFTASVKFSDNESEECLGFDFALKYDETVFEVIDSKMTIEKGATILNDKNPGSVNFVLVSITPVQYTGELFSVTFRVKQDAGGGETALRISSDNSDYPIESEEKGVETSIQAAGLNIKAPIKPKTTNTDDGLNPTLSDQTSQSTSNNINNTSNSNAEFEENDESIENEQNKSNTQENTQTGLPTKAVIIIIVISIIGVVSIFALLRKKKK